MLSAVSTLVTCCPTTRAGFIEVRTGPSALHTTSNPVTGFAELLPLSIVRTACATPGCTVYLKKIWHRLGQVVVSSSVMLTTLALSPLTSDGTILI